MSRTVYTYSVPKFAFRYFNVGDTLFNDIIVSETTDYFIISSYKKYTRREIYTAIDTNSLSIIQHAVYLDFTNVTMSINNRGGTILHEAVKKKRIDIVRMLIKDFKLKDDIIDNKGNTALMHACSKGYFYLVKLLTNPHNLDLENNYGFTPVLQSYRNRNFSIAKWLLRKGANYNRKAYNNYMLPQHFITETLSPGILQLQRQPYLYFELGTNILPPPPLDYIEQPLENKVKEVYKRPRDSVLEIIIKDFITKGEKCPIELIPLTLENTVLTNCYHAFTKDAIASWLVNNKTCPVCRENCITYN